MARLLRLLAALGAIALVTAAGRSLVPVNATTIGFAYLLVVLILASLWGFLEAAIASVAVDEILPLEGIAPSLRALCVGQRTVV